MPGIQKHRRTTRLQSYDYTRPGAYFVTVCTRNRKCFFGDITGEEMHPNEYGRIVQEQWKKTARIRSSVELDQFVIMPNHLHGIVILKESRCRDTARRVPTPEQFGKPVVGSLSTVIRSFKSAATKRINLVRRTPGARVWQPRYYEHVIRNKKDLSSIREYIITNPAKWASDSENPVNIK